MMNDWLIQELFTVFITIIASSGFWSYLQKKYDKRDASKTMLIGIAHDRIVSSAQEYLDRGWVSEYEYENLIKHLYEPYKEIGGNGIADRMVEDVKKLPIKKGTYSWKDL